MCKALRIKLADTKNSLPNRRLWVIETFSRKAEKVCY